jgi:hypothetical protein
MAALVRSYPTKNSTAVVQVSYSQHILLYGRDRSSRDFTATPLPAVGKLFIIGHNHGHHLKYVTYKSASFLIGTHHGHFEVASRQDVKDTIILALAPVLASLFRSKLRDRGRLREATAELACLHGRRKLAHLLWMLRETNGMEEAGLGVENLPFLTESTRIVNDCLTVTRNHLAHSEIAREAGSATKVLTPTLLNQDRNKVLVRLDLNALATSQMHFEDMLLVGGLRVRERES